MENQTTTNQAAELRQQTEQPIVTARNLLSVQGVSELTARIRRNCIVAMIAGGIGLLTYIVLSVVLDRFPGENILLWVSAVFFAFGLVFLITATKAKKGPHVGNVENVYEFYPDCLVVTSYRGNEFLAKAKHRYDEIKKFRQTKNFIFLYLKNNSAYMIEKALLQPDDAQKIRSLTDASARREIKL